MFRINLATTTFLWTYVQALSCSSGRKHVFEYVVTLACCERSSSLYLNHPYYYSKILFQLPVCIFCSVCCSIPHMLDFIEPKLHNLFLHRTQNCIFNIFQKLRKFVAFNFEPVAIINICLLCIIIHDILPGNHNLLHHLTWLDLFPILAFKILNFAIRLTFCSNIFFNVIL